MSDLSKIQSENIWKLILNDLDLFQTLVNLDYSLEVNDPQMRDDVMRLWGAKNSHDMRLVLNNIEEFKFIIERDLDNYVGMHVTSKDNTSVLYHFCKSAFECDDIISDLKVRFRDNRLNNILKDE